MLHVHTRKTFLKLHTHYGLTVVSVFNRQQVHRKTKVIMLKKKRTWKVEYRWTEHLMMTIVKIAIKRVENEWISNKGGSPSYIACASACDYDQRLSHSALIFINFSECKGGGQNLLHEEKTEHETFLIFSSLLCKNLYSAFFQMSSLIMWQ